jgi:lysyl-tRNA synthetase class 2
LSLEQKIYEERRAKLKQIEALGQSSYPTRFEATHSIPQILNEFSGKDSASLEQNRTNVAVAGRLMAIRGQGKAGFAHLQQHGQRLQIYVKLDFVGEKGFALWRLLDLGDYIGVRGYLFRTKTNELTVHVEEITFLVKDLLPLPEKWHGLADVELRYRQRYLDLFVNPEVRDVFIKRSKIIHALRRFLDSHGYIEVETPMMQPIAGGAVARPFVTHHNTLDIDLFLRIAPELYLKRLVVGGLDRVYEINRNFRNEGISTLHNPEFTMLEFYHAYIDYRDLMNFTQQMFIAVAQEVNGSTKFTWSGSEIDMASWQRLSMRDAIMKFWPVDLKKPELATFSDENKINEHISELTNYRSARNEEYIAFDMHLPLGAKIAALFEAVAEEHLIQPTIIYDFPAAISPLSKNKPGEPDWVERFEVFIGGLEIANGFSELNDPEEQRRRFQHQLAQRERGDEEAHAMDEDYIRALSYGLPPTAGEGVGIDRFTMLLTDSHSIRDVILFPLLRPEKAHAQKEEPAANSAAKKS